MIQNNKPTHEEKTNIAVNKAIVADPSRMRTLENRYLIR